MAERQRATVDVHLVEIYAELLRHRERLSGEGLVELEHVDVIERDAGAFQRLPRRRDGSDAHDLGRAAGHRGCADAGQRLQAMRLGVFLGDDEDRGGPIGQRRGGPRGDRAFGVESGLQARQRLQAGIRPDGAVG
jgi:hypothetical protein